MVIEISELARAAFIRLPRDIRRAISVRAQELGQGSTRDAINHGGGIFSFKIGSDIVVYVSVQRGVSITIKHIIIG
jgi:hypothetical protein